MSLTTLGVVAAVAIASFVWQAQLRQRREHWIIEYSSIGIMTGFMTLGLIGLAVNRNLDVVVNLVWGYSPHAYNLVIWPILVLAVLRPRFGPMGFLVAFLLTYGIDEVIWNSIAFVYFKENSAYLGYTTTYWQTFFVIVLATIAASYFILKPRIIPNWTWGFFVFYVALYTLVAGLPTYVDAPYVDDPYVWIWELMWQGAIWVLIYGTFWPRGNRGTSPREALV